MHVGRTKLMRNFNAYLKESGLDKYISETTDLQLSLYHDLGIYGDIAESCLETLTDVYGVDLSAFEFDKYFPPEFEGYSTVQSFLFSCIPFLASRRRVSRKHTRLTLGEIKSSIESGFLAKSKV